MLLAVALVGVSMPALEDARAETTAERIGTEAERIERAATGVVADSVAVEEADLAARGSFVVRAPSGFGVMPLDELMLVNADSTGVSEGHYDGVNGLDHDGPAIDGTGGPDIDEHAEQHVATADVALAYRLRGEPVRFVPIPSPADTVDLVVDDGPIRLDHAGESRIEFRFVREERATTVHVARTG